MCSYHYWDKNLCPCTKARDKHLIEVALIFIETRTIWFVFLKETVMCLKGTTIHGYLKKYYNRFPINRQFKSKYKQPCAVFKTVPNQSCLDKPDFGADLE